MGAPMNSRKQWSVSLLVLAHLLLVSFLCAQEMPEAKHAAEARVTLREGWSLQTSAKVDAKGEVISTPQFAPTGWHEATVPTTVVSALVKDKTFPDPLFGMNLRDFPGMNYPIGGNFSKIPMAPDSPYVVPWRSRKQLQ